MSVKPEIAIVTPSFNQGAYLDQAMRSVLDQPVDVEYVVMDGGSSDGSVSVIQQHADRLASWTSEPDGGQYRAINRGFAKTTAPLMGWLNSDDLLMPGAVAVVVEVFSRFPQIDWLTTRHPLGCDAQGRLVGCGFIDRQTRRDLRAGESQVQQESTFWRRSLWDAVGGLNEDLPLAADFDLWLRFSDRATLFLVDAPLGCFRMHEGQKSAEVDAYRADVARSLALQGFRRRGLLGRIGRRAAGLAPLVGDRCHPPNPVVRYDRQAGWRLV